MSLPKIESPVYSITVPSLKKKYKFRPFLVKEEKILLIAKESDNLADILSAVKQIINNCCLDSSLNVDKLSIFDIEYIFIKIRSFSVDNIVKLSYRDLEDEKIYNFEIDLETVEVSFPEKLDNNIKISPNAGIIMKYPSASLYDDKEFTSLDKDYMFELIIRCIDKIYEGDNIFEIKDYKKEEIAEFLEQLTVKTYDEIQNFLTNSPKLKHVINYKNSLGNDRSIELNSLNDFFTWR
jgi:hypothetical protein